MLSADVLDSRPWERRSGSLRGVEAIVADNVDGEVGGGGGLGMAELGVSDVGEEGGAFLLELSLALSRSGTKLYAGSGKAGAWRWTLSPEEQRQRLS